MVSGQLSEGNGLALSAMETEFLDGRYGDGAEEGNGLALSAMETHPDIHCVTSKKELGRKRTRAERDGNPVAEVGVITFCQRKETDSR